MDIKEYVLLNIDLNGKVINKKNLGLKLSRREDILSLLVYLMYLAQNQIQLLIL